MDFSILGSKIKISIILGSKVQIFRLIFWPRNSEFQRFLKRFFAAKNSNISHRIQKFNFEFEFLPKLFHEIATSSNIIENHLSTPMLSNHETVNSSASILCCCSNASLVADSCVSVVLHWRRTDADARNGFRPGLVLLSGKSIN